MPVPTQRAAVLIALAAPLALLVATLAPGGWLIAPGLGVAVLGLVMVDVFLAGRLAAVELVVPTDVEVGDSAGLDVTARFSGGRRSTVEAAVAGDSRLFDDGRLVFALDGDVGSTQFVATRRGTGAIERLWLRWTGPLGLGARQLDMPRDDAVRVWPNLGPVRSPAMQVFLRESQFGLVARRIRGEGTQFEALAEYQPGMDRRRIDWKASARHRHLFAKEYETERNNQLVLAFDCGQAMCEPVDSVPRIDRAVTAALAMAYVALKSGDRVALFGFAGRPGVITPFVSESRDFHRLQSAAAGLDYQSGEANFTLGLATLAARLKRRSLIVLFSDFTDPTSAELLVEATARLASRHLVVVVTLTDTELLDLATAEPEGIGALTMAVTAGSLLRQRALVSRKLRALGVDVVEAPHAQIGTRLIDAYLAIKRAGAIG